MSLPTPYYQSERVTLYHGDCLAILPNIEGVGGLVTDPPYSSGGMVRGDRMASTRAKYQSSDVVTEFPSFTGDNRDQRGFAYWCVLWLAACRDAMHPGSMACVFTDWRQLPSTTDAFQSGGFVWRGIVPWDKVNARPVPGRFRAQAEYMVWGSNGPREMNTKADNVVYGDGVLRVRTPPTADREHATQKPVELLESIIRVACNIGEAVLDPFTGSGTTGVACIKTGRKFIGIEIDEKYCEIAAKRIQQAEREAAEMLPAHTLGVL